MQSEEAYKHPKDCGNPYCEMCNYNRGYAEGRKAMERELEELFNTARSLCIERNNLFGWENDEVLDFVAYKKMRGIE